MRARAAWAAICAALCLVGGAADACGELSQFQLIDRNEGFFCRKDKGTVIYSAKFKQDPGLMVRGFVCRKSIIDAPDHIETNFIFAQSQWLGHFRIEPIHNLVRISGEAIARKQRCSYPERLLLDLVTKFALLGNIESAPGNNQLDIDAYLECWSVANVGHFQRDSSTNDIVWEHGNRGSQRNSVDAYPGPLTGDHGLPSGLGRFFSGLRGIFGISQAFADEVELPQKQECLATSNKHKEECKEGDRITRRPLPEAFPALALAAFCCGFVAMFLLSQADYLVAEMTPARIQSRLSRRQSERRPRGLPSGFVSTFFGALEIGS